LANLVSNERARNVREMFTRIASVYDLMNRVMTAGQDIRWRREVIQRAEAHAHGRLLDLGVGTGDLVWEALKQYTTCQVVGIDFTLEMMRIGQQRSIGNPSLASRLVWVAADVHELPFPDNFFDSAVSAFLLRNLGSVNGSLAEQFRVLKPGGKIVVLDTTPPRKSIFYPIIRFHLHILIPALGKLIARQPAAYKYLSDTTLDFLKAEVLAERIMFTGFQEVGFRRLMFGAIAIHWGRKPV
jgi:demethylmenaquinone methyltransferase/2-methoxy-6-polyprenyl-1,4-benzoquinol methylase